jgi:hypothetical protein
MPVQDRLTQIALSKQVNLNTPAASGTYQIGVKGGAVASIEVEQEDFGQSWGSRLSEGHDRGAMTPGAAFDTVAMPKSIGLLLHAALGSVSTTGSGPYTHVLTHANVLPYLTIFARKGSEYWKVSSARVSELELEWEGTKALGLKVTSIGCGYQFLTSAYPSINDERPKDGALRGAGGTFEIDGAAATVRSGSLMIANDAEAIHGSSQSYPVDVFYKKVTISGSLNVVVDNLNLWREHVTGSSSGTTPSARPYVGSLELEWVSGAHSLTFTSNNVTFATEFPDTDPDGGPVELTVAFEVTADGPDADAYSFTLVNDVASY